MTRSVPRRRVLLAWTVPAACAGLIGAGLAIGSRIDSVPHPFADPEVLVVIPLSPGLAVVGALILSRHPGHRLGRLYASAAIAMAGALFAYAYAWYGLVTAPGALPGALAVGWVSTWIWTLGIASALTFGLLLYPDGRLPSPPWWPAAVLSGLAIAALVLTAAFSPAPLLGYPAVDNPFGIPGTHALMAAVRAVAEPLVLVGFGFGVAALVTRFWRAPRGAVERRQVALLALASAIALGLAFLPSDGSPAVPAALAVVAAFALIPAAIGVAILRHHLYDIDLVLNRALVYSGLTAAVVGLYAAVVWAAAQPLGPGTAAGLLATGVAAAAVLPLRTRLQRLVDRAMYGERGDPYAAVSRLTARLQAATAPADALAGVAEAVASSLRLPYVAVESATGGVVAAHGAPTGGQRRVVPLSQQGQDVGRLVVEGRDGKPPAARDLALLAELARPAGAAVQAAALADALRTSQRRLIGAREEERRRLRRDLHDGLGPTLAGFVLRLDAAAGLVATDPGRARQVLAALKDETSAAVDDIRRLVYDLRPPALDELGLLGAVRQQAERLASGGSGMDVRVTATGPFPRLGAATEVAAYRIALEAVTNAARHAAAPHCDVLLAADGQLRVEVTDDGRGISAGARAGVGLAAMQERAAEVGGRCTVSAVVPSGTRVLAVLPLETR